MIRTQYKLVKTTMESVCLILPGHSKVPQICCWVPLPGHLVPPPEGEGLLHKRCLVCRPPPQVAEHSDQAVHEPHPPFTVRTKCQPTNTTTLSMLTDLWFLTRTCILITAALINFPPFTVLTTIGRWRIITLSLSSAYATTTSLWTGRPTAKWSPSSLNWNTWIKMNKSPNFATEGKWTNYKKKIWAVGSWLPSCIYCIILPSLESQHTIGCLHISTMVHACRVHDRSSLLYGYFVPICSMIPGYVGVLQNACQTSTCLYPIPGGLIPWGDFYFWGKD